MRAFPALALATPIVAACASEPRSVPIVGPDGTAMFHVSCGRDEARCFELSGQSCPHGYEMLRTQGEVGNYLVRCRNRVTQSGWAPALDLAPSPYATPLGAVPYRTPMPMTTVPPGYPPLGPGDSGPDAGY
jgi:hypothetical protein